MIDKGFEPPRVEPRVQRGKGRGFPEVTFTSIITLDPLRPMEFQVSKANDTFMLMLSA